MYKEGSVVRLYSAQEAAKLFPDWYGPEDDFEEEVVTLEGYDPPSKTWIARAQERKGSYDDGLREFPSILIKESV